MARHVVGGVDCIPVAFQWFPIDIRTPVQAPTQFLFLFPPCIIIPMGPVPLTLQPCVL